MKRRRFVRHLAQASTLAAFSSVGAAALRKPSKSDTEALHAMAEAFLREHGVEGMAIAYGRDGDIAFEAGFGFADAQRKEAVTPAHRFRIASISKPITSAAVMLAAEKNLLTLDSKVFGPEGLLGEEYGRDLPEKVLAITVDHLLTHTSGGWGNEKDDPMFQDPSLSQKDLITSTLANVRQTHAPGEHHAYSNFGYCLLGRVLEKVTKLPYETLLTQHVLSKCGITRMRIAGNTLAERQPDEVLYHTEKPDEAYGMNVARMDAHGGWIATAGDLVRFSSQLKKTGPQKGLLTEKSIRAMTAPGVDQGYARGWAVNAVPNWWHGGSLPGTSTIMVHTAKGVCWAGLLNRRKDGLGGELDKLMWQMAGAVKSWGV